MSITRRIFLRNSALAVVATDAAGNTSQYQVTIHRDSATGGVNPATQTYATIRILRSTGVEAVTDQQQAEFLKQ